MLAHRAILAISFASLCTAGQWAKEPDGFMGAKFLLAEANLPPTLKPVKCIFDSDGKQCYFTAELADAHLDGLLVFSNDALGEVQCIFCRKFYSAIRDIFMERYGPENAEQDEGGVIWRGARVSIELHRDIRADDSPVGTIASLRHYYILGLYSELRHQILMRAAKALSSYEYQKIKREEEHKMDMREREEAADDDRFKALPYGTFSITLNAYVEATVKRKMEEKKKAAGAL